MSNKKTLLFIFIILGYYLTKSTEEDMAMDIEYENPNYYNGNQDQSQMLIEHNLFQNHQNNINDYNLLNQPIFQADLHMNPIDTDPTGFNRMIQPQLPGLFGFTSERFL